MSEHRRTRAWWQKTVARWRQSGLSAEVFAARVGAKPGTLRWWSSALNRGNRAKHGAVAVRPIEIAIDGATGTRGPIEIAIGQVRVRCEVGTDVDYVASLVRAMGR